MTGPIDNDSENEFPDFTSVNTETGTQKNVTKINENQIANGITKEWPGSRKSFIEDNTKKRIKKKSINLKKQQYAYQQHACFQLALEYYNRQDEVKALRHKKKVDSTKTECYIEKINMSMGSSDDKTCKKCKEPLNGVKHFENKNKPSEVMCYFCLCKKLRKKVGENESRLRDEINWLNQQKIKTVST